MDYPSEVTVRKEDFEAAIELLGGMVYMTPGRCDGRVRARFDLDEKVSVEIYGMGIYHNPKDGKNYYARGGAWTGVRFQLWGGIHTFGKGARSAYIPARDLICGLLGIEKVKYGWEA